MSSESSFLFFQAANNWDTLLFDCRLFLWKWCSISFWVGVDYSAIYILIIVLAFQLKRFTWNSRTGITFTIRFRKNVKTQNFIYIIHESQINLINICVEPLFRGPIKKIFLRVWLGKFHWKITCFFFALYRFDLDFFFLFMRVRV